MRDTILAEGQAIIPADEIKRLHTNEAPAWIRSGAPLFRITKPANPPKYYSWTSNVYYAAQGVLNLIS